MNHKEIKKEARKLVKGKIESLFFPALVIVVISIAISLISEVITESIPYGMVYVENGESFSLFQPIFSILETALVTPIFIGYIIYLKKFLAGKEYDIRDVLSGFKYAWVAIIVAIIVNTLTMLGAVLLIVPGVIIALSYSMTDFIIADGEKSITKVLQKSRELIYGYKWDYFVFTLSYLGWLILSFLTLGILFVWLIPYFMLGQIMYYQKLKLLKFPKTKAKAKKVIKRKNLI